MAVIGNLVPNPQPVSGTVTANVGTTGGASTLAEQQSQTTKLTSLDTKTPALGQGTMAASVPVTIASNQTAVPISGSVTATGNRAVSGYSFDSTLSGTFNIVTTGANQWAKVIIYVASVTGPGFVGSASLKVAIGGVNIINLNVAAGVSATVGNGYTITTGTTPFEQFLEIYVGPSNTLSVINTQVTGTGSVWTTRGVYVLYG